MEFRLQAGEHVIGQDFTNRHGVTCQGLKLAGTALSRASICGAGINETPLTGGGLWVESTGGLAPFCLEGVNFTNPKRVRYVLCIMLAAMLYSIFFSSISLSLLP